MPAAHAASPPCAAGQIRVRPLALAWTAAGSTPATAASAPSSASSPSARQPRDRVLRHRAHDRQQAERDRQVEMAAFLGQIGGRKVDGDPLRRQGQAHGEQRGAHAFAAFRHRLVGQADDGERRQPVAICTWTSISSTSMPAYATVATRAVIPPPSKITATILPDGGVKYN